MKRIWQVWGIFIFLIWITAMPAMAVRQLVPVGQVVGIELSSDRVCVSAIDELLGTGAKKAGLKIGDEIEKIDGSTVHSPEDVHRLLMRSDGTVELTILRDGQIHTLKMSPEITAQGPRLGVYLRAGISGIGTVTWYDPETGEFGALGHGVNNKQGKRMEMTGGKVYDAGVVSVRKGETGHPGQLMGTMQRAVGELSQNTDEGIFGRITAGAFHGSALPVASWQEVTTGEAVIRSTVEKTQPRDYSVEILKIYPKGQNGQRNLLLRVTDPELLSKTGGIVQGMSGSPILQNGKLIGAVTHVLVNDPTTGYGIFIENMLDAAS